MNFFKAEYFTILLFFISFYGLITSRNIIKSIVSILLMEMAVTMFIISIGFTDGMTAPIGKNLENSSDPLPQALVITAIIIGVTVAAVNLTMLISLYRQFKTTDWDTVKKKNTEPRESSDSQESADSQESSDSNESGDSQEPTDPTAAGINKQQPVKRITG